MASRIYDSHVERKRRDAMRELKSLRRVKRLKGRRFPAGMVDVVIPGASGLKFPSYRQLQLKIFSVTLA